MTLEELEKTVADLPPDQLARFREWFLEFDAKLWDEQLESDIESGKLDSVADRAIRDHREGKSTTL